MDGNVKERNEPAAAEGLPPPCRKVAQLAITAMLVMLIGLLSVCTWYFAYSSPRLAVTRLTESLRKEILDSTVQALNEIFRWNAHGAKALVGMLEKDLLGDGASLESFGKIRAATWSLFNTIPLITSIGVTSLNGLSGLYVRGGLFPYESDTREPIFVYTKSTEEYSPFYVENVNSSTGEALADPVEYHVKEPRSNWFRYTSSVPHGVTAWHLASSPVNGRPYIQCGIPVLCNTLKHRAVVHCSHSASAITEYLSSTLDLKGGNVFVSNDMGEVLFSSEEQCARDNTSGCQDYSEVGEAVKFIQTKTHLKELVKVEIHYTDVQIKGRQYFIDSWYHSFHGVNLAVVTVIPGHSFWGPMDTHARLAWAAIPIVAVVLSFVVCGLITYLLMERVSVELKLRAELLHQLEAKRRAEASRDAKTAFLSHMSHELRTPMACIIGLLEILMGELKLSEHESSVKQVHRCATSLVTLLNSALDIAKVEAGKLELEKAEFDLEMELSSLIDVFSVQCDAKGLQLSLQLSDGIPKLINGDPARVMQIFTNLIGNSIKFTPKGRIIVRGWVDEREQGSGECTGSNESGKSGKKQVVMMFEVDDTGPGIDEALREKVFENFVQGDASTPRTHGGTGLGLGIVRSLVHLMGGAIRIGDKIGNGTVFQFSLCFDLPSEQMAPRSEAVKARQIVLGMPERDCRGVVTHWLENRGLPVHEAGSWEDVLLRIRALPLFICERKIEENMVSISQAEDTRWGRSSKDHSRQNGDGTERLNGGCAIRRSKSDGTSDCRVEKPVLIVDVDLLPPCLDESEYLNTFQKLGFPLRRQSHQTPCKFHALVWVTASNTPAAFKRVLKLISKSIIVRRPLHASRLRELFHQLEAKEEEFRQLDGIAENLVPSPLSLKIVKQLGVMYSGDETCCIDGGTDSNFRIVVGNEVPSNEGADKNLEAANYTGLPNISSESQGTTLVRSKSDNVAKLMKIPNPKPPTKALENLEIMVAEDHPLLRKLATTLLRKLGATPYEACNGEEALSLVVTRLESGQPPFHCILMDCQMPIMDGYDACRAVRELELEKKQHTCIIALTANAMATDEQRCFHVGMDAFLSKPIQQDHLIRVILSTMTPATSQEISVSVENAG